MEVSVVVNYCSNEEPFIHALLEQCRKFTNDIVVVYGSHFHDGRPENMERIENVKQKHSDITFAMYDVDISLPYRDREGVIYRPHAYWCNLGRWTGVSALKFKRWTFFMDADEIPDGERVSEWLRYTQLKDTICYKMANYWYFKLPTNQATTYEDSIILVQMKDLTRNMIFGDGERDHTKKFFDICSNTMGMNGKPLFHHYSWVRTKEGMRKKLNAWSHRTEFGDLENMVDAIFKNDNVNDIVHRYSYVNVPNFFNIIL